MLSCYGDVAAGVCGAAAGPPAKAARLGTRRLPHCRNVVMWGAVRLVAMPESQGQAGAQAVGSLLRGGDEG